MVDRAVPAIIVRVLVHIYEEQSAWVKLVDKRSSSFGILNGTRQGSVLSPAIFAVYLDGLYEQLRKLGVGCHIGGWWYGATCFADDLVLLAPARSAAACSLEHDAAVKRARFIDKTVELREVFSFALPSQVIRAVQIYASDCYGVMLYDLASQSSESYFKAWNTCVKLTWDVPRSTYTYIVENTLAAGLDIKIGQIG